MIEVLAPELRGVEVEDLLLSNAVVGARLELTGLQVRGALAADGVDFRDAVRIAQSEIRHLALMGSSFANVLRLSGVDVSEQLSAVEASFEGPVFVGESDAAQLECGGRFDCAGSTFAGPADFGQTRVRGFANFSRATFVGPAVFRGFEVDGEVSFHHCRFSDDLYLARARVSAHLGLVDARVDGLCFWEGLVAGELSLRRAVFSRAAELGPFAIGGWLILDQAVFDEPVRLMAVAETVHCHRAVFRSGGRLELRGDVVCDGTVFPSPSELAELPGPLLLESRDAAEVDVPSPSFEAGARVLSLRGADVGGLAVSQVDMRGCLLAGAHRLDQIRVGAGVRFARTASFRLTARELIAEELLVREGNGEGGWPDFNALLPRWLRSGAYPGEAGQTLPVRGVQGARAADVAEVYRGLRKAREDAKDSPGAADFYYGEMEMRRWAARDRAPAEAAEVAARSERVILNAYWLVSGYGLRGWRALTALLVALIAGTLVLQAGGYEAAAPSVGESPRFAVSASTSLLRPLDDAGLNCLGFTVELLLWLTGPALLALALLALRARVKR